MSLIRHLLPRLPESRAELSIQNSARPIARPTLRPAATAPDSAALGEARSRIDARLAGWVSVQEREALAQAIVRSPVEGEALLELRAAAFGLPDAFTLAAEKRAANRHTDPEPTSLTEAAEHRARTNHDGNDAA